MEDGGAVPVVETSWEGREKDVDWMPAEWFTGVSKRAMEQEDGLLKTVGVLSILRGKRGGGLPGRPESAVEMSATQESQLSGTEKVA